jgi:hypothetical protein
MNNQEIIDNAPEGATHIEDNSNLYIKVLPRVTSTIFNDWFIFEIDQWIIIDTYNVLLMRSLADIKRIVELEKESDFLYEIACESTNPEWLSSQLKALKEDKP